MKKHVIFIIFMFATLVVTAQTPFEGKMVFKVLNSYSDAYLRMIPQVQSGADVVEVSIKGDVIHEHYQKSGIHKIYNAGRLYYYSENTKTGFSLPEHFQSLDGVKEVLETNQERTLLGKKCSVSKTLILMNNSTVEMDHWLTEETYNIPAKALKTLYTDLCSRMLTDFDGKLCMKLSARVYLTGNNDKLIEMAKNVITDEQRKRLFGSTDKKVAEMSLSQIFEVVSITPEMIPDAQLLPPADVQIEHISLQDAATAPAIDKETFVATLMANPMMKKLVKKGKVDVDKMYAETCEKVRQTQAQMYNDPEYGAKVGGALGADIAKSIQKGQEDMLTSGATQEDASYNAAYVNNEKKLLLANKEYLKSHNIHIEKQIQPVAYDLDEEWDF